MKLKTVLLILIFSLFFFGCTKKSKVIMVIDGDTFKTSRGEVIRIIGIDAPEIKQFSEKFNQDVKFWQTTPDKEFSFANASKRALEDKILNQKVSLKSSPYFDHEKPRPHRVGRKLRYVYLGNEDISSYMLSTGNARIWNFTFSPIIYFHKKMDEFKQLQNFAKESKVGIWNATASEVIKAE